MRNFRKIASLIHEHKEHGLGIKGIQVRLKLRELQIASQEVRETQGIIYIKKTSVSQRQQGGDR